MLDLLQGSTLSLAYAQHHPERVKTLTLRGIFTLRRRLIHSIAYAKARMLIIPLVYSELAFFYQEGASHLFPEAWDEYVEIIPEAERQDMILAYHAQLNSVDEDTRIKAARAWSKWEMATSRLFVDPKYIARAAEDNFAKCVSLAWLRS